MLTASRRSRRASPNEGYLLGSDGIYIPAQPVRHRDEEYDAAHFDMLLNMQQRHFWYRGRHRFLLSAVTQYCDRYLNDRKQRSAVDLGGGCGGWVEYLQARAAGQFSECGLADSSIRALQLAAPVVGKRTPRYQVDLLNLQWNERWDVAFLLDVLEHIPPDIDAMREIESALRPGGLLFVTTPALKRFWSYNDELALHVRRYSRHDFARLASETALELCDARYFMTLLSPLLLLSRLRRPPLESMSDDEKNALQRKMHEVPSWAVNQFLATVFAAETPLGHWLRFPWGTSILGVFRKPVTS